MKFEIPVRTYNILNERMHWESRARRAKKHRALARMITKSELRKPRYEPFIYEIEITRIAPRPFDRHDGLPASMKAIVDGIADALEVNDSIFNVTYLQRRGKPKEYSVEVTIL